MRKVWMVGLLLFGLTALSTPALIAGTAGQNVSVASDGDDYDTGGG